MANLYAKRAIEIVTMMLATTIIGLLIGWYFGWEPEFTASFVVAVQMGVGGWTIRGWVDSSDDTPLF
jgi:hypothetical protein